MSNPALVNLLTLFEGDQDEIWVGLDSIIMAINQSVEAQLNAIIHHPRFKALESTWVGLAMLVDDIGDLPLVKLEMLNLSKRDLQDDFEEYFDLSDSGLFFHLYKTEYDQAGGEPYASVLLQYEFANTAPDLNLLKMISKVAASCHCPAVANATPGLFNVKDYQSVEEIEDFDLLFEGREFIKWRQLRQAEDARYLALILPKVLARRPYTDYIFQSFRFNETVAQLSDTNWTYATYMFGMILGRSFSKYGWCVHIRGPRTGGLIPHIEPLHIGCKGLEVNRYPLEIVFSDYQEHKLSDQGFVVLNYFKETNRPCVFSAPTIQSYLRDRSRVFNSNDRLAASLPYIYLVSRIAHYQKVIQRENVGTVKEAKTLELELANWLKKLVTSMPDPNMDIRSRFPLRGGMVSVKEDASNPGFFDLHLILQPHLQLEGVNAELTLISKLPRSKE